MAMDRLNEPALELLKLVAHYVPEPIPRERQINCVRPWPIG
jgi:hypothetical protein